MFEIKKYNQPILWGLTMLCCFTVLAQTADKEQKDLEVVQKKLEAKKAAISQQNRLANQIQQQLKDAELDIAKSVGEIRKTQSHLQQKRQQQADLERRKQALQVQQKKQEETLSDQLRSAYMVGNHDYVRLLFNQQDASRLSRLLTYYQYLNEARIEQLEALDETVKELIQTQQTLDSVIKDLRLLVVKQQAQQQTLNDQQAHRQTTLAKLKQSIQSEAAAIEQLQISEKNLMEAIMQAQQAAVSLDNIVLTGLQAVKGRLLKPTQGRFRNLFGKRRRGQVRWNGVLYEGNEGTPVVAIHQGKVLYADWLKGLGLVTVVDHGEGFMSLYGHNQALLKQVGDVVQAGENIALVGQTGGRSEPSLYFEIRHKGKAINPNQWIKR